MEKERKLKFWFSITVRLILGVWIGIKIFSFFVKDDKFRSADAPLKARGPYMATPLKGTAKGRQIDSISKTTSLDEKSPKRGKVFIYPLLAYQGKPLENAYVKIEGCAQCSSSVSTKSGKVTLAIPSDIYTADRFLEFTISGLNGLTSFYPVI